MTRVGDIIKLFWAEAKSDVRTYVLVQTYELDQATIDKGWLSFSVDTQFIKPPEGAVYYTLYDLGADDLQTSAVRTIKVNLGVPGGLDPQLNTAINEGLTAAKVSPSPISNPATPVTVTVPAWEHMEAGDELVVLWNGIRVSAPVLTQSGVGVPQVVSIPQSVVEQGGSSEKLPVNYEIRDIVDNYSLLSPATLVDVNIDPNALPAPRLADANPVTNQIDLQVLGAKDALVQVRTDALTAGDEVILTWTGRTPTTELSETLPSQTVTAPGFEVLLFNIPNAKVVAFAGGSISAKYTVGAKVSKSANATLSGLVIPLTALELEGAVGGVIDLAVVTGDPLIVSAPAYAGQTAGDRILLSWAGTSATGVPVNYPDEYTVQPGEEAEEIYFEVPRQNLDPLGGGTLQLSYQVVRADGTRSSPVTTYSVTSASLALPPPNLVESSNGQLAPMRVLNGATVQISYPNPQASDEIALLWNGKNDAAPWQSGAAALTFTVPPSEVGPVIGKTIDVLYAVKRGGVWFTSPVLIVTVLPLMEGDIKMVKITQATESTPGTLDLSTFVGDAEVVIERWPFIAEGQLVWLDMISETSTQYLLTAYPVNSMEVSRGITRPIRRPLLEMIPDGSLLEFAAKVQFDGSGSATGAQDFPTLKVVLQHNGGGTGDVIEDFETYASGNKLSPWVTPHMTFVGVNMKVDTIFGSRCFYANVTQTSKVLNITLEERYRRATMSLWASGDGGTYFRCIYKNGLIDEKFIGSSTTTTCEFTHDEISSFQVVGYSVNLVNSIIIDNLKLYK